MKQPQLMSFIESLVNILVGFGISLAAQVFFLPLLGVQISLSQNFVFALIMTVISIARSYLLRRLFEALHLRHPVSPFMLAVMAERRRQIEAEGWTATHDDEHAQGELAQAGGSYAIYTAAKARGYARVLKSWDHTHPGYGAPESWPWTEEWWKPTGFRRDLVKACALIVAEGEKFDRNRKAKRVP